MYVDVPPKQGFKIDLVNSYSSCSHLSPLMLELIDNKVIYFTYILLSVIFVRCVDAKPLTKPELGIKGLKKHNHQRSKEGSEG